MAKQPSKPARDDSSAGVGAAAVSRNTSTVAAAKPCPSASSAARVGVLLANLLL